MESFYMQVIRKDARFDSANADAVVCDLELLEPGTRKAVIEMGAMAQAAGHFLKVAETYRSQVRQHHHFTKGLTELSKVGMHGYGLAADLQLPSMENTIPMARIMPSCMRWPAAAF